MKTNIPARQQSCCFNAPTKTIVAIAHTGPEYAQRKTHRSYDALQYPMICILGEDGYHIGIMQADLVTKQPSITKAVH